MPNEADVSIKTKHKNSKKARFPSTGMLKTQTLIIIIKSVQMKERSI